MRWRDAEAVGRGIAEAGAVLVCGGRSGVMEAASRGAREAGGEVIGILPSLSPGDANEYVSHPVATGVGHARNLAVVASGDAVIAIGGEWGTLSEIALARRLERPVIGLRPGRCETAPAPTSASPRPKARRTPSRRRSGRREDRGTRVAATGVSADERCVRGLLRRHQRGRARSGGLQLLTPDVRWHRPPDVPITGTLEGTEKCERMWAGFDGPAGALRDRALAFEHRRRPRAGHVTFRGTARAATSSSAGAQVFTSAKA